MESDLDLISHSTDDKHMIKGELFNLLEFGVVSQKMEALAPYCHVLMTEITYIKHTVQQLLNKY